MSVIEGKADAPAVAHGQEGALARRALGATELVFFIVASAAPLAVIAGGVAVGYLVSGNRGLPFLFVPLGLALVIFAIGYAAMSRHVADAGAFYTYAVRGLGRIPGVAIAFVALTTYSCIQWGLYGLFGLAAGAFAAEKLSLNAEWYVWAASAWAVIAVLGLLKINLNARVLALILSIEVLVVLIYDLAIAAEPGPQGLSSIGFSPSVATGSALGAALILCIASFVGFEAGAIYSEEVKDPKRTVGKATLIAVVSIAVFYALSSWMLANSVGPDTIVNPVKLVEGGFTAADGKTPDPTTILYITGTSRLGAFWGDVMSLLFATSVFAALLSFHNSVARYIFALGRERVLPNVLSRTNRLGSPYMGSLLQSASALVVVGWFVLTNKDPALELFNWLVNLGAVGVLLMIAVTSLSVLAFFMRNPDREWGVWRTIVAPAVSSVIFFVVLVLGVSNFNVLITGSLEAPTETMTIVLLAILFGSAVVGLAVGLAMRQFAPERYARIGQRTEVEIEEHVE